MNFYFSVFKNSKVLSVSPGPDGNAMSVSFELDGQNFMALNAGPEFTFTEAVSFFVSCKDQAEVNYYWGKLSESGEPGRCGWLKDKYGLSWQIVPNVLGELLSNSDPVKANAVLQAMLQMSKIDIEVLKQAAAKSG